MPLWEHLQVINNWERGEMKRFQLVMRLLWTLLGCQSFYDDIHSSYHHLLAFPKYRREEQPGSMSEKDQQPQGKMK